MFEQLSELVQQYGNEAVVNSNSVPNELNQAVIDKAGRSIISGLQDMVSVGNFGEIAGMLYGKSPINMNNPLIKEISWQSNREFRCKVVFIT
jgi:hypothetical protein